MIGLGFLLGAAPLAASGQDSVHLTNEQLEALQAREDSARAWIKWQSSPGIKMDSNRVYLDTEAKRLILDTAYAEWVYQTPVQLVQFRDALTVNNLRLAFWYATKLYKEHQQLILSILMEYDKQIPVDEILRAGFYTYPYFDPRITVIKDGRPEIKRPDLLDEEKYMTNDLIKVILATRESSKQKQE